MTAEAVVVKGGEAETECMKSPRKSSAFVKFSRGRMSRGHGDAMVGISPVLDCSLVLSSMGFSRMSPFLPTNVATARV